MSGEPDKEGNPTYVSASEGSVPTDENGMAVHKLYGRLVVRKSYIGLKTDGMVLVNVQKLDDSGNPDGALFSVPLAVKDGEAQDRSETAAWKLSSFRRHDLGMARSGRQCDAEWSGTDRF